MLGKAEQKRSSSKAERRGPIPGDGRFESPLRCMLTEQVDGVRVARGPSRVCGYAPTMVLRLVRPPIEAANFEVVLAHRIGLVHVKLRGDFDFATQAEQARTLAGLIDSRSCVVVDLGDVDFIDSSGLRFLVKLAAGHDGPLKLVNVPDSIVQLLEVTGLD